MVLRNVGLPTVVPSLVFLLTISSILAMGQIDVPLHASSIIIDADENEPYSPEIEINQDPLWIKRGSTVNISATVDDRYSPVENATLSFWQDDNTNDREMTTVPLRLIDGTLLKGKWIGTIPPSVNNRIGSTVYYELYFRDELNYTKSYESRYNVSEMERNPPNFVPYSELFVTDKNRIYIQVDINDSESGVENATLYSFPLSQSDDSVHSGNMTMVDGDQFRGTYETEIDSETPINKSNPFILRMFDKANNTSDKRLNITEGYESPSWPKLLNKAYFKLDLADVNLDNNSATVKINTLLPATSANIDNNTLSVSNVARDNISKFLTTSYFPGDSYDITLYSPDIPEYLGAIHGFGTDKTEEALDGIRNFIHEMAPRSNSTDIDLFSSRGEPRSNSTDIDPSLFRGEPQSGSFALWGDPSNYPFDRYYINLIFDLLDPELQAAKNQTLVTLVDPIKENWIPSINVTEMSSPDLLLPEYNRNFLNIDIGLERNYPAQLAIILPLLSIFLLLGAIFIFDFEDPVDLVSSRLVLTLGIFALIFTLPEVINSMKPSTEGPTIADSMLSIIIIATIAFTISSTLSSSSIVRHWFPKNYTWIDRVVFIIVSGIVVVYFNKYIFDVALWWLVPLIIFGLGYGLLLKLLGLKIKGPLFGKRKKKERVNIRLACLNYELPKT
jgi:hypothetical protein